MVGGGMVKGESPRRWMGAQQRGGCSCAVRRVWLLNCYRFVSCLRLLRLRLVAFCLRFFVAG